MSWQLFLIISIFCLSLIGLFHRSLLKDDKSDAKAQTLVFLSLGGLLTILIALVRGKLQIVLPHNLLLNFLILAILGAVAYFYKYRGYQLIGAAEVIIFSTTSKLWNVIGGFLFLNEAVALRQVFGSLIIIAGISIAIFSDRKFQINKGVLFVLLSAMLFGMVDINGYYILRDVDATTYQIYFYFLPVLALLLIQPKTITKIVYYLNPVTGIKVTLLSIFDTLGMLALFYSYQAGGKASVIGPLSASKVIITTILGFIILRERDHLMNKLVGAI